MRKNNSLQNALTGFNLPMYSEIPDVGLYLDQVAKFINSYLSGFPEMLVTPSMISNYAKQKLIDRVNKKTYTREQISILIYIVMTKTVLSIENIKLILNDVKENEESFENHYTLFRSHLVDTLSALYSAETSLPDMNVRDEKTMMMRNVVIAIAYKMYLERYFEITKEKQNTDM